MIVSSFILHTSTGKIRNRFSQSFQRWSARFNRRWIRFLLYAMVVLLATVTTWLAWPSLLVTTTLEADSRSDYLPYRLNQGDVLTQTLDIQRDGLKSISLSFDMPGSEDIPADTQMSLAIFAEPPVPGQATTAEPLYTATLTGEQLMGHTRTQIPVRLGRHTAGRQYTLVLRLETLPAASRLMIHATYATRYPLLVNDSQTGLGLTMLLTHQRFNWPAFLAVILLMAILAILLIVPLPLVGRLFTRAVILPLLLAPFLTLVSIELLNTLNPNVLLRPAVIVLSYGVILLAELLLVGLTSRYRLGIYLSHTLFMIMAITNHLKIFFRGDPFVAGDLISVTEAVHSINKLTFLVSNRLLMALLLTLIFLLLFWYAPVRLQGRRLRAALLAGGLASLVLFSGLVIRNTGLLSQYLNVRRYPWNQMMNYKVNGFVISWVQSTASFNVQEPVYQKPLPADLYQVPASALRTTATPGQPNIIAIMSESFGDFDNIRQIETSEPVTPFFDSLVARPGTLHGNLLVSVFGGGTCNTEFEFLTGSSMLFFTEGSLPYNSYFNGPTHGLPGLLRQQGYRTVAIHPYLRTFWDRQLVYPNIGFERFISLEDFPAGGLVRNFVGDEADFAEIIRTYQQKSPAERLFIFSVTMQNHFPYYSTEEIMAGLRYNIKLPGLTGAESVELYLSMLRQSDDALRQLFTYFADVQEPTLIVLFGDHLPGSHNSFNNFYETLFGKTFAEFNLKDTRKLYETPWLIWANYPLPKTALTDLTSPNFLGTEVLRLAGAAESPYFANVAALNQDVLAMNNKMVLTRNGRLYDLEHIPSSLVRKLDRYWAYEYDNIIRDKSQ